jgi:hypothetical protein
MKTAVQIICHKAGMGGVTPMKDDNQGRGRKMGRKIAVLILFIMAVLATPEASRQVNNFVTSAQDRVQARILSTVVADLMPGLFHKEAKPSPSPVAAEMQLAKNNSSCALENQPSITPVKVRQPRAASENAASNKPAVARRSLLPTPPREDVSKASDEQRLLSALASLDQKKIRLEIKKAFGQSVSLHRRFNPNPELPPERSPVLTKFEGVEKGG